MVSEVLYDRVATALARLKLACVADCLDSIAAEAATDKVTYLEFLDRLLAAEVVARAERDVAMKTKVRRSGEDIDHAAVRAVAFAATAAFEDLGPFVMPSRTRNAGKDGLSWSVESA